jgi:transposase
MAPSALFNVTEGALPMSQQHCHFDASRSLTALEQDSTIIAVIEMSQSKWLVAALVPGVKRHPLKKLDAQEEGLLKLLHRWRNEAGQAGREIKRIVVAYEAGRDGFWLARWLRARDIEAYVIHPTRKAEEKLKGLRTAEGTSLPENTRAELCRHLARLRVVREQIRAVERERLRKLAAAPAAEKGSHAMVFLIARVLGIGIETADMLVSEVLSRRWRDRKAIARYAGLTGSPDESGKRRRERGLARAGSARIRCGMIQFAWRFLRFQKDSALAQWFAARTADRRAITRKTMIVALARKLLIALWHLGTRGEVPQGVILRPAS